MRPTFLTLISVSLLFAAARPSGAALHHSLAKIAGRDTMCNVWVLFGDKPPGARPAIGSRALLRRQSSGCPDVSAQDLPVSQSYIREVEQAGGSLRNVFKWANAASFSLNAQNLQQVAALTFVRAVVPVATFTSTLPHPRALRRAAAGVAPGNGLYGQSFGQLAMIGVPQAHSYIAGKGKVPGDSVIVGVFDDGFSLDPACYGYVRQHGSVIADSDFVTHSSSAFSATVDHGAQTMSLVAGYDAGNFTGVAWAARFIVATTEYDPTEHHIEEDNWAAAMVWAEGLGVDVVTSSLGYRDGFTPPDTDYTYADMNGATTIIALAAKGAVQRGVIVVNAMGNDGANNGVSVALGTLCSPADVQDVVSVGAVDNTLHIAYFSSTGPTSDGRKKPDLSALGVDDMVPGQSGYTTSSGTSFSTPLVAGIVALVKQLHPAASAAEIRRRLYASCTLSPYQDSVDNVYGRGIPDALAACLDSTDAYVSVRDPRGNPIVNATVWAGAESLGVSDALGAVVVDGRSFVMPKILTVKALGYNTSTLTLDSLGLKRSAVLAPGILVACLTDTSGDSIVNGTVHARETSQKNFVAYPVSLHGTATVPVETGAGYVLYGSALGYINSSDTVVPAPNQIDTVRIKLAPRPASRFAVYPNVISRRDITGGTAKITIDFLASEDAANQSCMIAIRTVCGDMVWQFATNLVPRSPLSTSTGAPVTWNLRSGGNTPVSPGVYFLIIRYGDKTYQAKILVTG